MSDFHSDETFLRASAYLDGELDAAESALAEADPAVMAEVELLRALHESVRDVEPPTARVRERAINAALAEFDELRTVDVVAFRPRPSYARWLGAAAAVVGVGLLGVIIATAGSGDGDDDSAEIAFEAPTEQQLDLTAADDDASSPAAPLPESLDSADEAAVFGADAEAAPEAAEATMAAEAPAATGAPAATELAADAGAQPTASAGAPPFDPAVPIPDETTLGIVGRQLIAQQASEASTVTSARATPETACDDDRDLPRTILSEASYVRDGVAVPILIAFDTTNAKIIAIDPDTCAVVAVEP
jgi:hypothetical protein